MRIPNFKKVIDSVLILAIFFVANLIFTKNPVLANIDCNVNPATINTTGTTTIIFHWPGLQTDTFYFVLFDPNGKPVIEQSPVQPGSDGNITEKIGPLATTGPGTYKFQFNPTNDRNTIYCSSTITVTTSTGPNACPEFISYDPATNITDSTNVTASFKPVTGQGSLLTNPLSYFVRKSDSGKTIGQATLSQDWKVNLGTLKGNPLLRLYYYPNVIPLPTERLCYTLPNVSIQQGGGTNNNPCVSGTCQTALGPISTDPSKFITTILQIAIGLAGGAALIFMVIGSIKVLTSAGDPKKVSDGRDMIVAAVSGLLFLILSVLILRFIGNTLLGGLPGA